MIGAKTSIARFAVGVCALGLIVTGCASPDPVGTPAPSSPSVAGTPAPSLPSVAGTPASSPAASNPTAGASSAGVEHIVIIVVENQNPSDVLGSGDAPYISQLAAGNALATNYKGLFHPSLPNYLALTSGTNGGITEDCDPGEGCMAPVPNIAGSLDTAGRTWKMYAESMPEPCFSKNADLYGVRHNPFVYYPSVTGDPAYCAAHVVPLTQLAEDLKTTSSLPDYVFISPNVCNDMHDCPVATGDDWLSAQVPQILESPAFTKQNSLLMLTWDEDGNEDNTVATVFAGPAARKGFESARAYNHYSLLHTVESLWGLEPLTQNDRNAPVMSDLLERPAPESGK